MFRLLALQKKEQKAIEERQMGKYTNPHFKDLKSLLDIYSSWAYNSLHNSIKQHLVKRKVKVLEDLIVGFDTEYMQNDWGKNELLSAQASIANLTKIQIPIQRPFVFESLNTLTNESYTGKDPAFKELEWVKFYIENTVALIRNLRFGLYDEKVNQIKNYILKESEALGVENIVKQETNVLIQLKKSPIRNYFIKPKLEENLELSFRSLLNIVTKE
ncbi:hypothetical protein HOY80DRAFT_1026809 [Tuber brumale]|nr:hypothetical protein HOY80DRAFT_1026809 [Tuber brumale]